VPRNDRARATNLVTRICFAQLYSGSKGVE
jgi:hypothetical protein